MIKSYGNMDSLGIVSIKLATASLVIIILKLWSGSISWIVKTNIWWFVLALVIFLLRAGMGRGVSCREVIKKERVERRVAGKKKNR